VVTQEVIPQSPIDRRTIPFKTMKCEGLRGDIEPAIAPALLERLRSLFGRAAGRAVLNLDGVRYASMEGLRALQEAQKAATELGVELRLAGVEKALKEAFDLKGITPQFQIFPKVDAAVDPIG
jgi:anti-anti-sigma factor